MIVLSTYSVYHRAVRAQDPTAVEVPIVRRPSNAAGRRRRALELSRRARAAAGPARERILTTADQLFYAEGIHPVGVQRMVEEAGVTRVTFYRHFPSKDDLVLAYLHRRGQRARAAVTAIVDAHPGDPRAALHAWAVAFVEDGVVDEYRGCTFVNASAEYADPDHPVRRMTVEQRGWINAVTERLLRAAGHPEPAAGARTLLALRTGYVFSAGLEESAGWSEEFLRAYDRVVDER
jgi:AcrR family transcriptional regulator